MIDISRLGFGGNGIPDVLPAAVSELQRRHLQVVIGASAGAKMFVWGMLPEDTIVAVVNLTAQVEVDLTTVTVVKGGFTSTVELSGAKLLVCWCDKYPPSLYTDYQAMILAAKPVAYWPLDDPSGSKTARELVGTRVGTVSGGVVFAPSAAPSPNGMMGLQIATFSGNGLIQAAALPPLTSGVSMEVWARHAITVDGVGVLCGRMYADAAGHGGGQASLSLVRASGSVKGQFTVQNNTATVVPFNQWFPLVGTHDGQTQRLYLAGQLYVELPDTNLRPDAPGVPVLTVMGGHPAYAPYSFTGGLANVAYYDRVLTSEEIWDHFVMGWSG